MSKSRDPELVGAIIILVIAFVLIGFSVYTWWLEIEKNRAIIEMNERGVEVRDE